MVSAYGEKMRRVEGGGLMFRCPACGENHMFWIGEGPGPRWGFNYDPVHPTFTPSLLVGGLQISKDAGGKWDGDWLRDADGEPLPRVCHSFVTHGRILYLPDCTHALAGQTVDMPDWEAGQ